MTEDPQSKEDTISIPIKVYVDQKMHLQTEAIQNEIDLRCQGIYAEITGLRKEVDLQFEANQLALDTALKVSESKLTGMNEWRATITDLIRTFVSRDIMDAIIGQIEFKIASVEAKQDIKHDSMTRQMLIAVGVIVSGFGLILLTLIYIGNKL